jgi:lysophospholipase L1-like esterase
LRLMQKTSCRLFSRFAMAGAFLLVFLASSASSASAAPSDAAARNAAAREALVKGVAAVECGGGGLPGPFVCLADDAFNVVAGRNKDGTIHPVSVGAFCGAGRVVAFGHPNFLSLRATDAGTAQYLRNAAGWLRGDATGAVAVVRSDAILASLKGCGIDAVKVASFADAAKFPVVAMASGDTRVADYPAIVDYVKKGGGLMTEALTWGWSFFAERSTGLVTPALYFDIEKLYVQFGFVMGDSSVARTCDQGFSTSVKFPRGSTLPEALAAVHDGSAASNASLRAQVAATLVQAATACPPGPGAAFASLAALADDPAAQKRPSFDAPLKAEDYLARVATVLRQNAWQQDPARLWPADPAAAAYPGLPKAGAPVVSNETVAVDLSVARWRSTGLFAAAGAPITVRLAPGAEKLGLQLRVGTTADDITTCSEWKRAPLVTITLPLDRPELTFSTPFGGLLYVVVPFGKSGTADVTISGAVRAAHFVLGRDTNADWQRMLKACGAPQVEIEGDHYVITMFASRANEATDPEWVAKYWDTVVETDAMLTGFAGPRCYKERICADTQLRSGWLHDGYPMMYHSYPWNPEEIVQRAVLEKRGEWGVQHELGHNFQNRDWTFAGTSEVTVNFFTLYAMERAAGITNRETHAYYTGRAACRSRAIRWVEDGKSFETWKNEYFLALDTFMRIRYVFGWEPFVKMFREYRAPVVGTLPRNDQEKRDQWATRLSRILNRNFADYFQAWSWPLSASAVAECAKYPKFEAQEAAVLFEHLAGVPEDAVLNLEITPKDGAIANVGGWTSFVFDMKPEAHARILMDNLKCTGRFTMRVAITDETAGARKEFDYPVRDMNKDLLYATRIASMPFGVTPQKDHAYTVGVKVFEGEKLRFEGVSRKGAFKSSDKAFLANGPVYCAPTVKVREASPLRGKSILFLGDSLTEARCELETPRLRYTAGWPGRIGWANGMRWNVAAVSGYAISDVAGANRAIRNQVSWNRGLSFDYVVINGCFNDAVKKCPAGTIAPGTPADYNPAAEDFKTLAGSLEYLFWQVRRDIPTAKKVGFIIGAKVLPSAQWGDWALMKDYIPVIKQACAKWGVPCLDLWDDPRVEAEMQPQTDAAMQNGHPNERGYDILYPYVEKFVESL